MSIHKYYKQYKSFLKYSIKKNINYKPLIKGFLHKNKGRNNTGSITVYNRGGGVKRLYRNMSFSYVELFPFLQ